MHVNRELCNLIQVFACYMEFLKVKLKTVLFLIFHVNDMLVLSISCRSRSNYWNALAFLIVSALLTFLSSLIISLGFQKWCDSFVINRYIPCIFIYFTYR